MALTLAAAGRASAADPHRRTPAAASTSAEPSLSPDALQVVRWAVRHNDAGRLPFAIVDKRQARLHLFASGGRWLGSAPVLIGSAPGDAAEPGIGAMEPSSIPVAWRTTPAGRFVSRPGRNLSGEAVVWFDYSAGLAIHRLRPAPAAERRPERLASPSPADNRISLGCVVVAGAFYDEVVAPLLGRGLGVVYVLPEDRAVADWLSAREAAP